ncbi:ALF repeat-containing protein, partial [Streptomyces adustus]|uniref:ALF repeat-containing protein n=1 Tax=Streptomyces adustus TaxID=1609272 RepID=UPI0035D98F55
MRPTRAALLVAATALTPALLLTTPAFATGPSTASTVATATSPTAVDDMSDDDLRVAVARILADPNSGKAVVREANKALDDGSPEALRAFLETGYRLAQAEDDSVAVFRILGVATQNGDKAVVREANKALDDGSPEALRAFLETGYRLAQAEDDSVAVFRIL